ncbi:MAG: biopolymer transporter Tol, partial [Bacteroidota bacterium]|nr:biopolymer transporter Tol [Bacteroidota bacterium]
DKLPAITHAMSSPFVFTADAAIKEVLGISGQQLYDEWAAHLREEYEQRIAPVRENKVEGNLVADVGFGNFYPVWSPDGKRFAYVSNKTSDYFGQSAMYLHDMESGEEKMLVAGVSSAISWSPDGKRIAYSRYNDPSVYGHLYYDVFVYDLETEEEIRITRGKRAYNPSFSPDGTRIAFVFAEDGTINLGTVSADGGDFRNLTGFENGEQVFTPTWSPDGSWLVFSYAPRVQRGIARVRPDGSGFEPLIADLHSDARNPRYTPDGSAILYASDRSGIFNIYRHEPGSREEDAALTNVVGGAFMPAINAEGDLLYAAYTAAGYRIAHLPAATPLQVEGHRYLPSRMYSSPIASIDPTAWDWAALNSFDDQMQPDYETSTYERLFQSMMYFPTLRVDQFNPDNSGLELLKPGLMMYSTDVLNRVEFLASGSINIKGERDLYLNITYRDDLPLFSSLGLYPDLALEVFNVTRSTSSEIGLAIDTTTVDVDFNLLAFSAKLGHNLVNNHMRLELGYTHNRYTSTIGQFRNPATDNLVPATDNLYFVGNDISAVLRYRNLVPTRDREINPIGLRLTLFYNYEFNNFNPDGDFEFRNGILVPLYTDFNFQRFDLHAMVASRLPWLDHSLTLRLRGATILGDEVDDFFNYYAGGITGMQGYTYYALGGNELATAQVTYRFPIIPSMDLRIGHILFDKLYGGLFFDVGDAVMAPDQFSVAGLKKDAGFELRLETFSFSMYPTRIFFSGAYGLDEFTRTFQLSEVTYGKEWRWYFGMLFGFDLSDGF